MPAALSIHGRLAITLEGHHIVFEGRGDHMVINVPSRGALWALIHYRPRLGKGRKTRGSGGGAAQTITDLLQRGDLTVTVLLAGATVARAGVEAKPSWLSKLLGLGAIEVRPTGAVLALWKGKAPSVGK